jgi:hypothetical protein
MIGLLGMAFGQNRVGEHLSQEFHRAGTGVGAESWGEILRDERQGHLRSGAFAHGLLLP